MIYIPKYFKPEELLDRATWTKFGIVGLRYFHPRILAALDFIREVYPTSTGVRRIAVNDAAHQWRGLRSPACPEYKPHSGHSFGAAVDFTPAGITCEEMRKWILNLHADVTREGHTDHPILGIRRMEIGTTTWVHIDCLETDSNAITMVNH